MAGYCQKCGIGFEEIGPLCKACLPDKCNVAGLNTLAKTVGIVVRGKPFTRQHFFNLAVSSAFNMPTVRLSLDQEIFCTNVTTAVWEYERRMKEGNMMKKWNLPQFRTDLSSGSNK